MQSSSWLARKTRHRNLQGGCNELQVVKLSFLEAAYDGNPNKPGTGTISQGHLASQGDVGW